MIVVDENKPVLSVGVVAELIGVCEKTLRIWEQRGLIHPFRASKNNRRLYTTKDVERLEFIKFLMSDKRLNVYGVRKFLKLWDSCNGKNCKEIRECLNLWDKEE